MGSMVIINEGGAMDIIDHHSIECFRAALLNANGCHAASKRKRAQGKLRLLVMSDGELQELAKRISCTSEKTPEIIEAELCGEIDEIKRTAGEWLPDLELNPADLLPRN